MPDPTTEERREKVARDLRQAAYPGANAWASCSGDVRERWLRAADHILMLVERERDKALRKATAVAHELGEHKAAKAIRAIRNEDASEHSVS